MSSYPVKCEHCGAEAILDKSPDDWDHWNLEHHGGVCLIPATPPSPEQGEAKMMTREELNAIRATSNTCIAKALLDHISALEQREALVETIAKKYGIVPMLAIDNSWSVCELHGHRKQAVHIETPYKHKTRSACDSAIIAAVARHEKGGG